jgi:hypothetical protein
MDEEVEPLLQIPPLVFPERTTLCPVQKVVTPAAVMTEAFKGEFTVTMTWFEVILPQELVVVIK